MDWTWLTHEITQIVGVVTAILISLSGLFMLVLKYYVKFRKYWNKNFKTKSEIKWKSRKAIINLSKKLESESKERKESDEILLNTLIENDKKVAKSLIVLSDSLSIVNDKIDNGISETSKVKKALNMYVENNGVSKEVKKKVKKILK